jgi:hypothetical protein
MLGRCLSHVRKMGVLRRKFLQFLHLGVLRTLKGGTMSKVSHHGTGTCMVSILHTMLFFQEHGQFMKVSQIQIWRSHADKYLHSYLITTLKAASQFVFSHIRWVIALWILDSRFLGWVCKCMLSWWWKALCWFLTWVSCDVLWCINLCFCSSSTQERKAQMWAFFSHGQTQWVELLLQLVGTTMNHMC